MSFSWILAIAAVGNYFLMTNAWADKNLSKPVQSWESTLRGKSFIHLKSGKILIDRADKPPLLFLLGSKVALNGANVAVLPEAPWKKGDTIYLSQEMINAILDPEPGVLFSKKEVEKKEEPRKDKFVCENGQTKIFLDPGHGGEDAGATRGGIKEKDLVLKFAGLLEQELRQNNYGVMLSRKKDVFLPLEVRSKLAEKWDADLFVSLHANSSKVSSVHGSETYILSQDATDNEARKLALLENSIVKEAKSSGSAIQDILWDMEQTQYLQESAFLASHIQQAIAATSKTLYEKKVVQNKWKNRGVRQAPFYVLSRAPMPAVLVEIGYLTNANDRKMLESTNFLQELAKAVAQGIQKYKKSCR
ncbi:MAG: N-acetylmuramoyl-L-alanine amidase [Oligoflexia bacterium]|nr:N-acetylmuramoyl-L-alanine amidase [Oligoflexia bacterium]